MSQTYKTFPSSNLSTIAHRLSTSISGLRLDNFRNHQNLTIAPAGQSVVLTGPNGAGKTNILEAISLFAPGKGLRNARTSDFPYAKQPTAPPWSATLDLKTPFSENRLGTGSNGGGKRLLHADENPLTQIGLSDYLTIAWVTPDMDGLWRGAASPRRKFLDRLVYALYPDHWLHLTALDKARAERGRLLEQNHMDDKWLAALELAMTQASIPITQNRLRYIESLNGHINDFAPDFPSIRLDLLSPIGEQWQKDAETAQDWLQDRLRESRLRDSMAGSALYGAHRDDVMAYHGGKNRNAAECSTGEQKIALLSVLLAHAAMLIAQKDKPPVLLLDELAAHFDEYHRGALATILSQLKVQSWISGADENLFRDWKEKALFFRV